MICQNFQKVSVIRILSILILDGETVDKLGWGPSYGLTDRIVYLYRYLKLEAQSARKNVVRLPNFVWTFKD